MLVGHLPEDSAFVAARRGGPEMRVWTTDMYLRAATVNLLYAANRQRANKPTKKPLIDPPTPGKRKRRTVTVAQLKARGIAQRLAARR